MILVVGATGLVGTEVCRQLITSGKQVRALVRPTADPAKVAALRALPVETVEGDVRDRASLIRACEGVDGIVCTISSMPFAYVPGDNDIATVDEAGVRSLIDTARSSGVHRFVYVSFSGGIDRRFPLSDAKRSVERHLRDSGLDWTILRPSYFMEVWLSPAVGFDVEHGTVTLYGTGEGPISWISLRDVAAFAVSSLDQPAASRSVIELGGPRPVTPNEVVRIFQSTLGRPLETVYVPAGVLEDQQAAATDPMQASFAALMRCYAQGDPIEMGRTAEMLARPMTSIEDFASSMRGAVATS